MIVTSPSDNGVTLIDNSFIDHYMADANGEFVKIYLYLVRCACPGRDVSIPGIADFFEQTEGDVRRALNYWKSQGLVDLVQDAPVRSLRLFCGHAAAPGRRSFSDKRRIRPCHRCFCAFRDRAAAV